MTAVCETHKGISLTPQGQAEEWLFIKDIGSNNLSDRPPGQSGSERNSLCLEKVF